MPNTRITNPMWQGLPGCLVPNPPEPSVQTAAAQCPQLSGWMTGRVLLLVVVAAR
jgi:hypothetical protein